jgi:hypothetical protein
MPHAHSLRRPVESRRALAQRRKMLALGAALAIGIAMALAFLLMGCGGWSSAASRQRPCTSLTLLLHQDG